MSSIILDTIKEPEKRFERSAKHFLTNVNRFNSVIQGLHTRPSFGPYKRPYKIEVYSKPTFPNSFDDLTLGTESINILPTTLDIQRRLGKLDSVFRSLHLSSEECRKRVMCEVTREKDKFSPLADIFKQETKYEVN